MKKKVFTSTVHTLCRITLPTVFACLLFTSSYGQKNQNNNLPLSTAWTANHAQTYNQGNTLFMVCMIVNLDAGTKGTGFLLRSGYVVTNHHVINGGATNHIILFAPDGSQHRVSSILSDSVRDLALLKSTDKILSGVDFGYEDSLKIGDQVFTWGYPLQYDGPAPILAVGYVAGVIFRTDTVTKKTVKHLIINGAFNSGNSGGPLIGPSGKIFGVVQSKALAVVSPSTMSALQALAANSSGMMYSRTNGTGKPESFSEAQVIALVLNEYRDLGQVNIGEAISISELVNFMTENKIPQ